MKAKIINGTEFGGLYTIEFIEKNDTKDWVLTDILPSSDLVKPSWDGTKWYDTHVTIIIVPKEISRMKFEIQLYITTTIRDENNNILQFGKTFQDIIDYIDSLQMSNFYKNLLKMRLLSCVTLERDNDDLNALAPGMGISQAQLDEIFINGNSIE